VPWLYHKTTQRTVYKERAARHPRADQVVLTNECGEVTETTVANLAVRLDGQWWTPPIECGCLPGVARAELIESGRLAERRITLEELDRADGLSVVSALRGWRPAILMR
jgi:para-aminobenzoate synthetase/4-amino-4-deoxychorismate lyase